MFTKIADTNEGNNLDAGGEGKRHLGGTSCTLSRQSFEEMFLMQ